jgi:CheY-like chemotaxis protein
MTCVLVVDDDASVCDLVQIVLEEEGYRVQTASDGVAAMQRIAERRPDIVLLDLRMPKMDGWAFLSTRRQDPTWADLPIVLLSGALNRAADAEAVRACLPKPFDLDDLIETVGRVTGVTRV